MLERICLWESFFFATFFMLIILKETGLSVVVHVNHMHELRSIDTIKRMHTFYRDLMMLPAANYMSEEELEVVRTGVYEDARAVTLEISEKLSALDTILEIFMAEPEDENIRRSVAYAMGMDEYSSVKEYFHFVYAFPPAYQAQGKKRLLDKLISVARKDEYDGEFEDIDETIRISIEAEWEVNPKIAVVKMDKSETELKFQDLLVLMRNYLEASEHERYKQLLVRRLEEIFDDYLITYKTYKDLDIFQEFKSPFEESGGRPRKYMELKLIGYKENYGRFENALDFAYHHRAKDYLREFETLREIMVESEFTRKYYNLLDTVPPMPKSKKPEIEK